MIDRDIVIALAKQAGALRFSHPYTGEESDSWAASTDNIELLARLVEQRATQAEREACAQVGMLEAINGIEVSASIRARGTGGEAAGKDLCSWYSGNYGGWHSSCGTAYVFESGGPVENGHKFCHCCGKRLSVTESKDTNDNP